MLTTRQSNRVEAGQWFSFFAFVHHLHNFVFHMPRGFIRNAQMAMQFYRTDAFLVSTAGTLKPLRPAPFL